jgi:hypothetical protein
MHLDEIEWVYVILFGLWLCLSIVGQFHHERVDALRRRDRLHLLPIWTFFAPSPGRSDYHIISRDRLSSGEITPWRDVLPIPRQRITSAIWNPRKRRVKVVTDAVGAVVDLFVKREKEGKSKEALQEALVIYAPYLLLVNIVLHGTEHAPDAAAFQFAVVERFAFGDDVAPVPILLSPFHRLV